MAWAASVGAYAEESRFLAPASGDVLASGVLHEIRWTSLCNQYPDADELELLLSVDGGRSFSIRLTAELPVCASSFRWRIPALSSSEARLAVRVGREYRAGSEEIAFVSPPFRITSFASENEPELASGSSERWTEQALSEIGAEDLLGGALHGSSERLESSSADDDLDETAPGALPALAGAARRVTVPLDSPRGSVTPLRSRRSIPLPLRE